MRLIKAILLLPVVVCLLPGIVLIGLMILLGETEAGALRSQLGNEIRTRGLLKGYRYFMTKTFVPGYRNSIQSLVLVGAGFLIIAVGLRTLMTLPLEIVYGALALEYTLLVMWAVTVYYTDDSEIQPAEASHESTADKPTEMLVRTMEQLTAEVAQLEDRLRTTETRFEKFSRMDTTLDNLASKLEVITSDQIGTRVRQEFERLMSEVSARVLRADGLNGEDDSSVARVKGGSSIQRAPATPW